MSDASDRRHATGLDAEGSVEVSQEGATRRL